MRPDPTTMVESYDRPIEQVTADSEPQRVGRVAAEESRYPVPGYYSTAMTFGHHAYPMVDMIHSPQAPSSGEYAYHMGYMWRALPLQIPLGTPAIYAMAPHPYNYDASWGNLQNPLQHQPDTGYIGDQSMLYPGPGLHQSAHLNPYGLRGHDFRPDHESRSRQEAPGFGGRIDRRVVQQRPTPSHPRGPPRKPKQSGYALWVGNLPPKCLITDLKEHFSRDATNDIVSVFLITKSNCAFVNYRIEQSCMSAFQRFHESRFQSTRLVCRIRKNDNRPSMHGSPICVTCTESEPGTAIDEQTRSQGTMSQAHSVTISLPEVSERVPERFFIVKSLTIEDLEASVRTGVWATQSHNERALNNAYRNADQVYLIFSVNKSGEYYGYATMMSAISEGGGDNASATSTKDKQISSTGDGDPTCLVTPSTQHAPRGYIIDDPARGTIFWEADDPVMRSEKDLGDPTGRSTSETGYGIPFRIEWRSTQAVRFYRTRGLRNPWNSNREVKIARDGVELEPSVGQQLVQMFHRPGRTGAGHHQYTQQQQQVLPESVPQQPSPMHGGSCNDYDSMRAQHDHEY